VEVVRSAASESLANALPPAILNPRDARSASLHRSPIVSAPFDALHHRNHAFTRGDATPGWAHSTATTPMEQWRWLACLDARAQREEPRRRRRAESLPRDHQTLVEREAAFARRVREEKERRVEVRRGWVRSYGAEGAAAMEAQAAAAAARQRGGGDGGLSSSGCLLLKRGSLGVGGGAGSSGAVTTASKIINSASTANTYSRFPRRLSHQKVRAEDLEAVAALPDLGLLADE